MTDVLFSSLSYRRLLTCNIELSKLAAMLAVMTPTGRVCCFSLNDPGTYLGVESGREIEKKN
jgi:hypothetical protein